jgi:uncharacterized protein involved in response to NO
VVLAVTRSRHRARPPFANTFFFPAAAIYSALVVPWWTLSYAGLLPGPPAFLTPAGHAHEMIFGFAMAVVAGYLLGPQPVRVTLLLASTWIVARVSFLGWPGSWVSTISGSVFAVGFALRVVPRFGLAAKKWRNKTIAPIVALLGILTAAGAWAGGAPGGYGPVAHLIYVETLLVLAVLLFFMGGRIIAPAVAGHMQRRRLPAEARVQPRIEGTVLVLLLAAVVLTPMMSPLLDQAAGALLIVAGALTAVRLARWRMWHCRRRPDLLVLALGYGWLAAGLVLTGVAFSTPRVPVTAALHAIAVGALGTLTLVVMARTRLLYRFRDANVLPVAHVAALLISGAAVARVWPGMVDVGPHGMTFMLVAAGLWALAFMLLLGVLLRTLIRRDGTVWRMVFD